MKLFDEEIYFSEVLKPVLNSLEIGWNEFRERQPGRKTTSGTGLQ
jgi:hypothetical protein